VLWIEGLIGLLRRSLGSVMRAIFGWATLALFGEIPPSDRTWLSIAVGAAAAWPFLVIGVVFPKQAALVLALLPIPEQTPASLVRAVWIVLAAATPLGVGWIMARSAPPSRGGGWRRLLLGFPATLGLGLAFLVACVVVPIAKLSAFAARKKEEHVALVVPPQEYEATATLLQEALRRGGVEVARDTPPWSTRIFGVLLHKFAGALLGASVPRELAFFRGPDLEMTLYPNGVRVSGGKRVATRAHALITESATATAALQCMSAEGQKLERRIRALWSHRERPQLVDRRLPSIAGAMADAELDFADWEILYRQLLQLFVASRGGARLMEGAVRRRQRPVRRAGHSSRLGFGRLLELIGNRR